VTASFILSKNIRALLEARHQTQRDLAEWCRFDESWMSKLLSATDAAKGLPLKHLDRIADFFGLATYQLFQPGISGITERRSGQDRRSGHDRRISAKQRDAPTTPIRHVAVTTEDEKVLADLHALDYETYQRVKAWIAVARLSDGTARKRELPPEPTPANAGRPKRSRPAKEPRTHSQPK
jgi:transcriptional regulator with XRE-family HTH domain